ncbi:MAG: hypothetical protein AABN95_15990 [Acidobacteriota bacterium]
MSEPLWLLIFSVLVVITVALVTTYVHPGGKRIVALGSLLLTIIACVIFAAIHVFIVGGSVWGFAAAAFFIYAGSNLIFQLVKQVSGLSNL